jgi:SPP1 family predicted phage head-tail adaptor
VALSIGQLRTRVRIEQRLAGTDSWGQRVDTWTELATCWSDFRHTSGIESARAGTEVSAARASVRIRWREGISAAMRLVHLSTGAVYNIQAVLPDLARREHVDLVCEAAS